MVSVPIRPLCAVAVVHDDPMVHSRAESGMVEGGFGTFRWPVARREFMGESTAQGGRAPFDDGRGSGVTSETFLITDAAESYEAQHRARVRKYLTLMAFRVPALVIAGIVYSATGNGLLALGIVALSIPLPWVAVLVANDRPPRKRGAVPHYLHGADHSVIGPAELHSSAVDSDSADTTTTAAPKPGPDSRTIDSRTIDSHTVDPDS